MSELEILQEYKKQPKPPSLASPTSKACTSAQFDEYTYTHWCKLMHLAPLYNRKVWEFTFILQALSMHGALSPQKKGLGFGVGQEPLAPMMASMGCSILATDLATEEAMKAGWIASHEHAKNIEALSRPDICSDDIFKRLVEFEHCDMTSIPETYRDFDFCWSSCAFEHLGSIEKGLDFVVNSLKTIKPGGIAVHTTEFNCSSNEDTVDNGAVVLYRKRDFEQLSYQLATDGHLMSLNFHLGDTPIDNYIDTPPYRHDRHLKLAVGEHLTTSFGLIIKKADL